MCIHIHIYICIHICICIHLYMYVNNMIKPIIANKSGAILCGRYTIIGSLEPVSTCIKAKSKLAKKDSRWIGRDKARFKQGLEQN